jgi:hypothetical protein
LETIMADTSLQPGCAPANPSAYVEPATTAPTPFGQAAACYQATLARFNALPTDLEETDPDAFAREEDAYSASRDAVMAEPAESWSEFVIAFEIASGEGTCPIEHDQVTKLRADLRRLGGL